MFFRLLAKAGVKVSPSELAARASPTAPRRSDLPKLDSSLLHMNSQQQFPLPASMPPSTVAAMAASMMHNNSNNSTDTRDPEDLRVPGGVGGVGNPFLGRGGPLGGIPPVPGAAGPHMGSALLDTYLSMIAAAGGDSNSMAAALGAFPGRAAAFAQAASQLSASGAQQKTENTPQGKLGSDYFTTYIVLQLLLVVLLCIADIW